MATQTFTWVPDREPQLNQTPKVTVVKFGDGYETRTSNGLNSNPQQWTLQFSMDNPTMAAILTFVQNAGGVQSFYWTDPVEGNTNLYVCRKWRATYKGGLTLMNFDFEQVFEAPC
jgi:phage-related protein